MQLAQVRQERGKTQQCLADQIGVSRGLISLVELGTIRPYPSLKRRIAEALGVPLDELFPSERGQVKGDEDGD